MPRIVNGFKCLSHVGTREDGAPLLQYMNGKTPVVVSLGDVMTTEFYSDCGMAMDVATIKTWWSGAAIDKETCVCVEVSSVEPMELGKIGQSHMSEIDGVILCEYPATAVRIKRLCHGRYARVKSDMGYCDFLNGKPCHYRAGLLPLPEITGLRSFDGSAARKWWEDGKRH